MIVLRLGLWRRRIQIAAVGHKRSWRYLTRHFPELAVSRAAQNRQLVMDVISPLAVLNQYYARTVQNRRNSEILQLRNDDVRTLFDLPHGIQKRRFVISVHFFFNYFFSHQKDFTCLEDRLLLHLYQPMSTSDDV